MVNLHAGTWWEGLMNRIGLIYQQTAGETTIKSDIIINIGEGESCLIESEIWRAVVTGRYQVVEDDGI